jgi:ectoine hydroxylase-related dioxygenase (phytanoyl-CoA dioxygenase family)
MPATVTEPTVKLSAEQIEFFHTEGYLKLDAITTPEEVAHLRQIYDRLFAERWNRSGTDYDLAAPKEDGKQPLLPQIGDPKGLAPELEFTQFRANALAVARQLFGPAANYRNEHMIYKPARTAPATPWHQDQAYHNPNFTYRNINFWMPLQQATLENGCMQFVPRSHTWDVIPHHHINNDPRIHGLEADDAERFHRDSVACPLPAGGATLHHSYMLHHTGPNRSDIPRRAYIMVFSVPPVERKTPRVFSWQGQKPGRVGE